MIFWILLLVFFIAIAPIAIFFTVRPVLQNPKLTGGIDNCDRSVGKYVYKVEKGHDEILALLARPNAFDTLESAYDRSHDILSLFRHNEKADYQVSVSEYSTHYLPWLPNPRLWSPAPYYVNLFMIQKLNAKAYPLYTWY